MTREDLFKAIGQVEEHRLVRCDAPSGIVRLEGDDMENKTKKRPTGRMLRNVLVAAVVVALMATVAFAAPAAYEGIAGAWLTEEWEFYTPTGAAGNSNPFTTQTFEVEIQLGENAPEEIETYYMPQMPEGYTQSFGNLYGGIEVIRRGLLHCAWDDDTTIQGVDFRQLTKKSWERGGYSVVDIYGDNTAEIRETELGGAEGLLISVPEDPLYPKHHFYWEDGEYVFYMIFPYYVTEAEMAEIISSIHVVEDIRPYLISYCESEEYLNELLN